MSVKIFELTLPKAIIIFMGITSDHKKYNKQMKYKLLAFLCLSAISSFSYSQDAFKTGTISFNTTEINYGVIERNSNGVREFIVTNKGQYPLIITSCSATCGCTVPNCPQEPIMPGKSETIRVTYNTNNLGVFNKQITVYSNDQVHPVSLIKIYGEVRE